MSLPPSARHFWAAPFELNQEFGGLGPDPLSGLGYTITSKKPAAMSALGNTTIAIVATDATLDKAAAKRLAVAAHDGIGRATLPAHMPMDGDLVFSAATAQRKAMVDDREMAFLCHAGAMCLVACDSPGRLFGNPGRRRYPAVLARSQPSAMI